MRAFTEHMGGSLKDANLDSDPNTAQYGNKEEKVTLYDDGVPEMIGKKIVEKIFEGESATGIHQQPNSNDLVKVLVKDFIFNVDTLYTISYTDSKDRTTFYKTLKSTTEMYCSVAFI